MSSAVRAGYKLTDIGMIPIDWKSRELGELATFRTGPFGSALHKSDYTGDGVPVINPMHIVDSQLIPSRAMTITDTAATKLSEFKLKPGEVIIGRRGDMGRCAVVRDYQVGWLCGTGSMIVRPGAEMDADFLQRVLSSPSVISAIEDSSVGTTMINLNQSTLRQLIIQAPPVNEQRAIAAALSDVDALLAKQGQLIAKKQGLKQAAMQQLLTGQTRLPGFSGDWEVKRLGDVIEKFLGGGTPSRSNQLFWGDEIPWVTVKDFATFNPRSAQESITKTGLQNSASHLVPSGVLITSTRMALGKAVVYEVDVAINQDLKALFSKASLQTKYLYFWFQFRGQHIDDLGSGSTVKGISLLDLKKIEFQLPTYAEQTAIATILSDMDTEIAALEERQTKTRALKQGMMQELLTGRIRLIPKEK